MKPHCPLQAGDSNAFKKIQWSLHHCFQTIFLKTPSVARQQPYLPLQVKSKEVVDGSVARSRTHCEVMLIHRD